MKNLGLIQKPCSYCGVILTRRVCRVKSENIFCDAKCSSKFNMSKRIKEKTCKGCGNSFSTRNSGKPVSTRLYCFDCSSFGSNGINCSKHLEKINKPSRRIKPFKCYYCQYCNSIVKSNKEIKYCNQKCLILHTSKPDIQVQCSTCNKTIFKKNKEVRNSKSNNFFCNKSCSSKYTNLHRPKMRYGCRVSKPEKYIQKELVQIYPNIRFIFNGREAVNSELDIFLPDYKLAFEINGLFHYEPIFSEDHLRKIKNNDQRKFQACLERDIELAIIDISSVLYFKPQKMEKFIKIIVGIIDYKISNLPR